MISLHGVSKFFRTADRSVTAVDTVSLDIAKGEVFGIIGYSGAGKSTLIRLLNGLERPSSGRVLVNGADLSQASERELRAMRPKIGMIFQHFNLLWSRTVRDNIALPMQIAGVPAGQIAARCDELIGLVGLTGREGAYPSQLSGGQKQRVGIARALANRPEVLLCDEATSALDPETTDQILDLLASINRQLSLTIVLITHEMHVVRRICDKVAVMEAGRVVETGPVAQVFADPKAPITQRFLGQLSENAPKSRLSLSHPEGRVPDFAELLARFGVPVTLVAGGARLTLELAATGPSAEALLAELRAQGFEVNVEAADV